LLLLSAVQLAHFNPALLPSCKSTVRQAALYSLSCEGQDIVCRVVDSEPGRSIHVSTRPVCLHHHYRQSRLEFEDFVQICLAWVRVAFFLTLLSGPSHNLHHMTSTDPSLSNPGSEPSLRHNWHRAPSEDRGNLILRTSPLRHCPSLRMSSSLMIACLLT
jgi:hypothetical protein